MALLLGKLAGQSRSHIMRGKDWLAITLASCLHDIDFIPGLLSGDVILYHHYATHSLFFCVCLAGACWLINRRYFPLLLLAAILHALLDVLTYDFYQVYDRHWGIPLLWPFSDRQFWPPFAIFGAPYVGSDMSQLFSWVNVRVLMRELVFIAIVPGCLLLVVGLRQRRRA